jgi:hypothetical protein
MSSFSSAQLFNTSKNALVNTPIFFTPKQIGENGTTEYTWSNDVREKILQLSFQLTRNKSNSNEHLPHQVRQILSMLSNIQKEGEAGRDEYLNYMTIMFKMIGYTRDIIDGKGEYYLSYMLLNVWSEYNMDLAKFALRLFVLPPENTYSHPYGCWKDIKNLYSLNKNNKNSELSRYGIQLMLNQIRQDADSDNPSLAAKWAPREKSAHSEMFTEMAIQYYSIYMETAKTPQSRAKAVTKAKMGFRKLLSYLNKKLDTVQIKQCGHNWSKIDPTKQTSITMHKQKRAFLNLNNEGEQRSNDIDRIECAKNFSELAKKAAKGEAEINGKRVGLNDFTNEALCIISSNKKNSDEANILNAQWRSNSTQTGALGKMIPIVDVSGLLSGDPMNAAIALGIRVAEKSIIGKRVMMAFSESPTWVDLSGSDNFVDMVEQITSSQWGMPTNFMLALQMILDAIVETKLQPEDVEDMVLAIFSNMRNDVAEIKSLTMMESIEKSYADAGIKLWGKPFKTPHILFWNLSSRSGFPTLSSQKNASMMSGFSPSLLNTFCDEGMASLQSCTPWSLFLKSLENERYSPLEEFIKATI